MFLIEVSAAFIDGGARRVNATIVTLRRGIPCYGRENETRERQGQHLLFHIQPREFGRSQCENHSVVWMKTLLART